MNEGIEVVSCQELIHFPLRYPSIVIVWQFFLHLVANHQFRKAAPVMSVEKVSSRTLQVRDLFIFFLCYCELTKSVNLGHVA